ncbi:MAG: NAD-dependent succinate-semialdehyde dehydrogenase [Oligoflexia bacterium]|nr:NAD-dependent succinate-semialdehyde dehydrogenase [Oligoflexia bacterium]
MTALLINRKNYFAGAWQTSDSGRTFGVLNPATGGLIGEVPDCSEAETNRAIRSAQLALPAWRAMAADERSRKLKKFNQLIIENRKELSQILTTEQGKPLAEAEREILYAASFVEWFAEEARRVYGRTVPGPTPERRIIVTKQALGVCAAITPWNFPCAMITRKLAAALAAGCTMIVKPAPETPFSALALAELALRAEIPPSVFQVITGDAEKIASALMSSTSVRKLSFTGSTEVGKILIRQSAQTVKRLTVELGGNAPFIVFEDADIGKAVKGAMFAKYRNAGQTCVCVNRFIVHESRVEEFAAGLCSASSALKVGNGLDSGVEVGPLISIEAADKVRALIEDALSNGAKRLSGENISAIGPCFIHPTILSGVNKSMRLWNEEIFGPLCAISSFKTEEQALELANDTEYGLASYFYTKDLSRAFRVAEALESGCVAVNDTVFAFPQGPFGGMKQSGYGKEGGQEGIEEYLTTKYVMMAV